MKLNISYPVTGGQKMIEIEDEKNFGRYTKNAFLMKLKEKTLVMNLRATSFVSLVEMTNKDFRCYRVF